MTTLQAMRALLAKHQPDGLDELRAVRVVYPKPDGREHMGDHRERVRRRVATFLERAAAKYRQDER